MPSDLCVTLIHACCDRMKVGKQICSMGNMFFEEHWLPFVLILLGATTLQDLWKVLDHP